MVAKSYQKLKVVKEPYEVNGKMYVQVEMGNGAHKQVRWYSPAEYAKYYGEPVDHSEDPYYKSQKEILGFGAGFITIFKGNTYENKEWFKEIGATYRKFWGWGLPGDIAVPEEMPLDVTPIRLDWSAVGADNENLKNDDLVRAAVEALICEPSVSEYQGAVGDKLELEVTVVKAVSLNGYYGPSTMHIMEDADQNVYVWTTAAKSWSEGTVHQIRGTVKDHKTYKNTKQTVLTRCTELKK